MRALVGGLGAALLLAVVFAGPAAAAGKRVGVPKFEGAQEAVIRKRVMQILKSEGYELVKSREIEAAVQSTGASLDSNDGYRAIAKELALSAIVTGEISKKKARLAVRDGSDGSVAAEGSFAGANPRKMAAEVGKGFWRRLGSAIERGKVPAGAKKPQASAVAAAPEDNEDAPEAGGGGDDEGEDKPAKASESGRKAEAEGEDKESKKESGDDEDRPRKKRKKPPVVEEAPPEEESTPGTRHAWLDAAVGGAGFTRSLSYHQDVAMTLRQYQLSLAPALLARISFFPGALATTGPVANIGLDISIEQAVGITSKVGPNPATGKFVPNGATFDTIVHDFAIGLRYRQPIGEHELGVSLTGGEHAYVFRTTAAAKNDPNMQRNDLDLPDTVYRYGRLGLQARLQLPFGIALMAGGGYRYIQNKGGQIHDRFFQRLTVQGADAFVAIGYRFMPMMEARLGAELRRYWYDMHSQAGDPLLAGGAVDQYVAGTLMIAFRLGDEPKGAAAHDEDEKESVGKQRKRPAGGDSGDPKDN